MPKIDDIKTDLKRSPRRWLVTGVAGFIGSNLLQELLNLEQTVIGLDNFSTGSRRNLEEVKGEVGPDRWRRFNLAHADIRNLADGRNTCEGIDFVLHQAALGNVPRSIKDPIATNQANVDGFLAMLVAATDAGVKTFVYASSSSAYGGHPDLPKQEEKVGRPLSPYAVTKYVNELYAGVFASVYGLKSVGLRYFNVFGRRQDPNGPYSAVIPKWIAALLNDGRPVVFGDGETSRDFCYIDNVVQANILAAATTNANFSHHVCNVACGARTTLNGLFGIIKETTAPFRPEAVAVDPLFEPFRQGDIHHSLADISHAAELLGYAPTHDVKQGLEESIGWYARRFVE